jgi:hypothetical protein
VPCASSSSWCQSPYRRGLRENLRRRRAGFNVDLGFSHGETFRGVQLTPPGSACSIAIALGVGGVDTAAASIQGLHLVVDDIHTARKQLTECGVDVGGVQDMTAPGKPAVSYAPFTDPDGNGWTLQKLPYLKRQRRSAAARMSELAAPRNGHHATLFCCSWTESLGPRTRIAIVQTRKIRRLNCSSVEPPIGIEPMTYALRVRRSNRLS